MFFGLLLFFKSKTTEISLNSVSPTKGLGQFVTFLTIPPFTGKNNTFILGCLGGADGRNYSKLLFKHTHPLAWGHIRRAHFRNFNNADFPMRSQIPASHSQIGLQERRLSFSLLNYPFEPSNEGWVQPIVKTEPGYTVKLFVCLFGVGWSLKWTENPFSLFERPPYSEPFSPIPEPNHCPGRNPRTVLCRSLLDYKRFCSPCDRGISPVNDCSMNT